MNKHCGALSCIWIENVTHTLSRMRTQSHHLMTGQQNREKPKRWLTVRCDRWQFNIHFPLTAHGDMSVIHVLSVGQRSNMHILASSSWASICTDKPSAKIRETFWKNIKKMQNVSGLQRTKPSLHHSSSHTHGPFLVQLQTSWKRWPRSWPHYRLALIWSFR